MTEAAARNGGGTREHGLTVGDDGAGLGRDLELLGGELEHRGERRRLGHAKHFEGELGVGGEDDLERHLPASGRPRAAAARRRHG